MKMTLKVKGMGCDGCVKTVTQALKSVPGVSQVDVSLDQGRAVVETSSASTTKEQLIAAIEQEGYKAEAMAA